MKKEEKEKNILLKQKEYMKQKKYITKTRLNKKYKTSQSFMITESVSDNGVIHLKNGEVAKVLSVQAIDLSLSSEQQLKNFFAQLKYLYQIDNLDLKIYKLDELINLNMNKDFLKEMMEKFKEDPKRLEFLEERYHLIEKFEEDKTCVSNYYFVINATDETILNKIVEEVLRISFSMLPRLYLERLDNKYEIYHFLMNLYYGEADIKKILGYDIVEILSPLNVTERSSSMKVDNEEIELLSIKSVPLFLEGSFFEQIFNLPNTRCCIHVKDTIQTEDLIKVIDSSYQFLLSDRATTRKLSDATELDRLKDNYQLLMNELKNGDEKIKEVNFIAIIQGDKKQREEIKEELKRLSSLYQIKIDTARLRQYETWQAYDLSSSSLPDYGVYLPTLTLSAGFPLTATKFNDERGIMMGVDTHTALPVFFDMFHLDPSRTSHNISVVASTGGGKSFTLKKIIVNALNQSGTKIFIFDAEAEYKKLVEKNNGEYIDLYSREGGIINPLQIRFLPVENEDNENDITNCPLAKHLGFLETFYKCAFEEMSEKELVVLLEETEKLYENFGITKNSTISMIENLKPNEFPIFNDLKKLIQEDKTKIKDKQKQKIIEEVNILLERFLVGTDSFLFNDYTNLDLEKSDLIGFNLLELLLSDNQRLINTQMLNILTFLNNAIVKNKIRNEKVKNSLDKKHIMVVVDEFHLFIDENNPEILKNFSQMARRLRKYSSSFVCATQSIRDFIGTSNVLRHATAIFNNCQYQLTGMLKEDDLSAYLELFKQNPLTETQKDFLIKAKQGHFLLHINSKNRVRLWVCATPLERELMGENNE